jgi:hypothetical protein
MSSMFTQCIHSSWHYLGCCEHLKMMSLVVYSIWQDYVSNALKINCLSQLVTVENPVMWFRLTFEYLYGILCTERQVKKYILVITNLSFALKHTWFRITAAVTLKQSHNTPMEAQGWDDVELLLIYDLGTRWGWVVSVTPRPRFTPGKTTAGSHWTGGWVGPRTVLDTEVRGKISRLCRG